MRRIALSLPKRAMTYSWKGIHRVSGIRDTTCSELEIKDKAQALRQKIKELSSEFSKAQLTYIHRNLLENPDMLDKDSVRVRAQERQYKKEIYSTFFELMKLVNAGSIALSGDDLIHFHFEDQQNPAYLNKNNLQAWICRQLIRLGAGTEEVFITLANCIEQGAQIEKEDVYGTSFELMQIKEIELISDNRKQLASELRTQAQGLKPNTFR